MGLAEFFAIEPERPRKAFYRADELTEIGKKPISFRQVGDNLFGRSLQILKERYEPGSDTGRVPLTHDGEEGGIVVSGRLEVTVDDERRILDPGDAYYFESRRPHRFRCVGGKAVRSDKRLHAADVLNEQGRILIWLQGPNHSRYHRGADSGKDRTVRANAQSFAKGELTFALNSGLISPASAMPSIYPSSSASWQDPKRRVGIERRWLMRYVVERLCANLLEIILSQS